MRLLHKEISKEGGRVTIIPDDAEDMWCLYNLIAVGDSVRTETVRKVVSESATGSVSGERLRVKLTIQVEAVDFDAQTPALRLKGKNIVENEHVKLGAYHTLELEANRKFTLGKSGWDSVASEMVDRACDTSAKADLAAVVMQEGLAYICLITSSLTLNRQKIEVTIPRKQGAAAMGRDKALNKFYDQVMKGVMNHVDFSIVKCLIIASPGFVKDSFMDYIYAQAHKQDLKALLEQRDKFLLCHCSSGHMNALAEVMQDPKVAMRLADTKAHAEQKSLADFYKMLDRDSSRTAYGEKHINKAMDIGAIETLLLSDNLFRSEDPQTRKKYVSLVETVKDAGGVVRIFSTMHISGQQLERLSGLAAILRFPMDELEDEEEEEGYKSDDSEDWDLVAELLQPSKLLSSPSTPAATR
mmetsp:Transcript_43661/g.102822  ORF Transcript_43661/g.102822 Transcript_43661/m.102822 type:complete len:413 (-) Transcript_43661:473-1711(-)